MTKQQVAKATPAFFGACHEYVFQVGEKQEVVVAGNQTDATTALYAYLKASGNCSKAECIEERNAE